MRILFCSIVWMKKYQGISDDDKPKYFGVPVSEQNAGSDIFNFSEYNGKCYGYVRHEGDLVLPEHLLSAYRLESERSSTINDFLIVWCAFKDKNAGRIIGWYKNAVLHREEQYRPSFTNPDYELDYFFEANSSDCVLLPENQRTFKIEKAAKAGKGRGFGQSDLWFADSPYAQNELIPQAAEYIVSYSGPRDNFVLTKEMISALPREGVSDTQEELIQRGLALFEQGDFLESIKWLNAARRQEERPDVLYYTAFCLYHLAAFDKARALLEKSNAIRPDVLSVLELLAFCSDMTGDFENTAVYLTQCIDLQTDEESKEAIRKTIRQMEAYFES